MKFKFFNLREWFRQLHMFVILDPNDNSVTFSRGLYKKLHLLSYEEKPKAFVFRVQHTREFAFCINPEIPDDTPMGEIQYNAKYKTVGFECLVPTVNRIVYNYGLPYDKPVKLSVRRDRRLIMGKKSYYYIIERPCAAL